MHNETRSIQNNERLLKATKKKDQVIYYIYMGRGQVPGEMGWK